MLAGFVLRALPLVLWGTSGCIRDECSYRTLARQIVRGHGLKPVEGWLWAPGYPYLLAFFEWIDQAKRLKRLQVGLGVAMVLLVYLVTDRVAGRRAARIAAFLVALHPTLAFFAGTLWTETIYGFLLLAAALAMLWARGGSWVRAVLLGALLGACVLFRGVATYMTPIFLLAVLWPVSEAWAAAWRARWRHLAAVAAVLVLVVAPWSIHASRTYGGFVISDASLGQVMYVSNNDFPVMTYDYGDGILSKRMADTWYDKGRPHCDQSLPAAAWNRCEVAHGLAWIRAHPGDFLRRIPVRLAQFFDPNTFLTRRVRLGKWYALPWWIEELIVLWAAAVSIVVVLGGAIGTWARARGPYGVLVVGITLYYLAVVSALFGLSRFRAPLEPLWIVFLASVLADPRGTWALLRASRTRAVGAVASVLVLLPLLAWYLPSGFPAVWR